MRSAVLFEGNTPLVVAEVEPGALGPREARVEVEASGVCHTDLSTAANRVGGPPIILGHEGAGRVIEVGSQVTRVKVGDRVIASFAPVCGSCFYCIRGESTQCMETSTVSAAHKGRARGTDVYALAGLGTYSQLMTVAEMSLVPVNTDLPAEQLALIGCGVTTGAGSALWTAQVKPGSTVTVFGCGGVGLFAIQGARIAGASRIFAVDPQPWKRAAAAGAGATDLVDPAQGEPAEQIRALTGGHGSDYAIEVVGKPEVIVQAYDTIRPRGSVIVVGMGAPDAMLTLPAARLFRTEKRIIGSFYGSAQVLRDMPALVGMAESGQLDIGAAVTRRIGLDDVNDAFRAIEAGEVVRSVIIPA